MEIGQKVNIPAVTNTMMVAVNQNAQVNSHEAMARRLKNRERQRRYRARKRLLADLKKAQAIDPSIPTQRNMTVIDAPVESVTHVHCLRDWKKDARRAHILKEQGIRSNNSYTAPTIAGGDKAVSFSTVGSPLYGGSDPSASALNDIVTQKHVPSRRHWKAEARNKKT